MKKLKDEDIAIIDKDSILDSEIAKIGELPRHHAIQQTFQSQPWLEYDSYQGLVCKEYLLQLIPMEKNPKTND